MILEGSRYADADVQRIDGRDTVLPLPQEVGRFSYQDYVCTAGDRIDLLAQRFLNDPQKWWVIARANPQWLFYGSLPGGLVLRIPLDGGLL